MLQNIRDNSKGIVSKILVSLIAFTFVIWGADALWTVSSDNSAPAEVNGEEISLQELLQTSELQRRQILASNPDIDPVTLNQQAIQSAALQQLIGQRVMLQYTQNNAIALSDAAVDQMIVQSEDFQVNGVFNRELFESLLRNFGLTPTTYRQQLKRLYATRCGGMPAKVRHKINKGRTDEAQAVCLSVCLSVRLSV